MRTRTVVGLGVWLVICALIAGVVAPQPANQGFRDSASVLAFISLAAVGIERAIEGFFGAMSSVLGQWWPLRIVRQEFDTFEKQTDELLGSVVDKTLSDLEAAKASAVGGAEEVTRIQAQIESLSAEQSRLQTQFGDVTQKLVPGSDRLALVAEINTAMALRLNSVHQLSKQYTADAQNALRVTGEVADRASRIIASFHDNPARRVASLVMGAGLGMLVAGGTGLNLFVATLAGPPGSGSDVPVLVAGSFGVLLTGLIIGLGSAPTHEVVKSLQAYKENRIAPIALTTITTGALATPGRIEEGLEFDGRASASVNEAGAARQVRQIRRSG